MGMTHEVRFTLGQLPVWDTICERLISIGEQPILRMIDGLPAFPDEVPEPTWCELRINLSGGMITLRRSAEGFACIGWGKSDASLQKSWNALAWACAAAGQGSVLSATGTLSPEEFAQSADLHPA